MTIRGWYDVGGFRADADLMVWLLADDPTGALDSRTTEEVLAIFDDLHRGGITLVLVTHEDDVAARASQVVHFRDGRVVAA